jgi:hypothetical protein
MFDIESLRARQRAITAGAAKRGATVLNDQEDAEFRQLQADIAEGKRSGDLSGAADKIFNASHAASGAGWQKNMRGLQSIKECATYSEHNQTGPNRRSFFRDLVSVSLPGRDVSGEAAARLARHNEEMRGAGIETRDLNTTVGYAGSFVPPAYLLDQYITYARPGRPTANIVAQEQLLQTMQVNIPKITTGTAVASQYPQNTAVQETDITDAYVTANVVTIAGFGADAGDPPTKHVEGVMF